VSELWIATENRKKRAELERLLAPLGCRIRTVGDAPSAVHWTEDRPDFAGNAEVKATALSLAVGRFAIGDDSGLCVAALGGAPGVHSARWAGPDATDADRIDKLLHELGHRTDRQAAFVCHVCLCNPKGDVLARFEERCEGRILDRPRGEGGFGYDPVFVPDAYRDRRPAPTFAELTPTEKDEISHRGLALQKLAAFLADHPLPDSP
jgi:XTP/dITP diphosphohydrolase